jgi:hypothetical protein
LSASVINVFILFGDSNAGVADPESLVAAAFTRSRVLHCDSGYTWGGFTVPVKKNVAKITVFNLSKERRSEGKFHMKINLVPYQEDYTGIET